MDKRIFINSILIMILSSCSPTMKNLVGEYEIKESVEYGKLILNMDSTFCLYLNMNLLGSDTFEGTWSLNKKELILNPINPKIKEFKNLKDSIFEKHEPTLSENIFKIFEDNSDSILEAIIPINNEDTIIYTQPLSNIAKIDSNVQIRNFSVWLPGKQGINYEVKNSNSNYFEVYTYQGEWVPYIHRAFPYKWEIKNKTLFKNYDKQKPYKRI